VPVPEPTPVPVPEPTPVPTPTPPVTPALDTTTLFREQATVTMTGPGAAVVTAADGRTATVTGSEIRFADGREVMGTDGNAALVDRLHQAVFDRDLSGLGASWAADGLDAGTLRPIDLARGFLAQDGAGSIADDGAFIATIWENATDFALTEPRMESLQDLLGQVGREEFVLRVADGEAARATQAAGDHVGFVADWGMSFADGLIAMAYGRDATLAELQDLDARLDGGWSPSDVARALTATEEFASRTAGMDDLGLAQLLHQGALGRDPDAAEITEWSGRFAAGADAGDLAAALADYWEFQLAVQTRAADGIDLIG